MEHTKGKLHNHVETIHIQHEENNKVVDHTCIAVSNIALSEEVQVYWANRIVLCCNSHDGLVSVIRNALTSLAIINMPVSGLGDVAMDKEIMDAMAESFKQALAAAQSPS